jgi:hypothetical protein
MNGNGEGPTGSQRLDRIERALELLVDDHVQFREQHKHLLAAQVLLTGSLDRLTDRVDKLGERLDKLTVHVDKLTVDVNKTADVNKLTVDVLPAALSRGIGSDSQRPSRLS